MHKCNPNSFFSRFGDFNNVIMGLFLVKIDHISNLINLTSFYVLETILLHSTAWYLCVLYVNISLCEWIAVCTFLDYYGSVWQQCIVMLTYANNQLKTNEVYQCETIYFTPTKHWQQLTCSVHHWIFTLMGDVRGNVIAYGQSDDIRFVLREPPLCLREDLVSSWPTWYLSPPPPTCFSQRSFLGDWLLLYTPGFDGHMVIYPSNHNLKYNCIKYKR